LETDSNQRKPHSRGASASPGHFENPLDYIAEVHMSEREVCALIDRMVSNVPISRPEHDGVFSFLEEQLPQHLADEEIDLFPLMVDRCDPEEEIDVVIKKLQSDHQHALVDASRIAQIIRSQRPTSQKMSEQNCIQLAEFAAHSRRHLILENAIILPIARLRLTATDLKTMRQHMLDRRGLTVGSEETS